MQAQISPRRLAILLGTLVALGPLAIDTYLPALLAMSEHFAVPILSLIHISEPTRPY